MRAPPRARPDRDQRQKVVLRIAEDARADYVGALLAARPALRDVSVEVVRRIACLLWRLDAKQYQHRSGDGSLSIAYQELDGVFGARKFTAFNQKHQILVVHEDPYSHKQTKRYSLHADISAMDERYLAKYTALNAQLTELLKEDGTTRRVLPKAVASKDKRGNTAKVWGEAGVRRSVPVNLELLRSMHAYYGRRLHTCEQLEELRSTRRMHKLIGKLLADAHTVVAGRGEVMIRYMEVDSGRLYACGINMQNINKVIRFAAMHGMYDYDVENCHYSIFKQMAMRFGLSCKVIDDYLANKKDLRHQLAADVGCTVEQIKECLLAIMYGASSFDGDEKAIPLILGKNTAFIARFQAHPWITALRKEVKARGKVILHAWPHRNRSFFVNEAGKSIDRDKPPHEILAHLMQGAEAMILRAMFNAVADSADVVLLQHDGFTVRRLLDTTALEAAVLQDTGYRVTLEEREICAPEYLGAHQNVGVLAPSKISNLEAIQPQR